MEKLYLDFESYSECDIKKRGGANYAHHPSTDYVCLGWSFNDEPVYLNHYRQPKPEELLDRITPETLVYAHNATFDFRIWNLVMVPKYGWPRLRIEQIVDTMALCQRFTLPGSLSGAGGALNIEKAKSTAGTLLIKSCCCPTKKGERPHLLTKEETAELTGKKVIEKQQELNQKFTDLFDYCIRDVEAMKELCNILPMDTLPGIEKKIWQITYEINEQGLPIALHEAVKIRQEVDNYTQQQLLTVPAMVNHAFGSITQTAKVKEWCHSQGVMIPDLTKDTVEKWVAKQINPLVKQILKLRQELGKTSTAKYTKLIDQAFEDDGYYSIKDVLAYHAAGTGRWAGRGFQMHNLPRATLKIHKGATSAEKEKIVEATILDFMNGTRVPNPTEAAKALIRPMIKAPKGWQLIVADYKSIENRVISWLAGDFKTLDMFVTGLDQYTELAAQYFGVDYDKVDSDQRQMGKRMVLGAQFGMGQKKFKENFDSEMSLPKYNHLPPAERVISLEDADKAIKTYRARYHEIVQMWYGLSNAAKNTIETGERSEFRGMYFNMYRKLGRNWLFMKLPSGRNIFYLNPRIEYGLIPGYESMGLKPGIKHEGFNSYNRQWTPNISLIPGRITENCLAEGTKVFTDRGWINIEDIDTSYMVHDGYNFVSHTGLIDQGEQYCLQLNGVYMTPDQEVLKDNETWSTASQFKGQSGSEYWRLNSSILSLISREDRSNVATPMQVWKHLCKKLGRFIKERTKECTTSELWMQENRIAGTEVCRKGAKTKFQIPTLQTLQCMEINDSSMYSTDSPSLEKLWWKRDYSFGSMAKFRSFLEGYGINISVRSFIRKKEQQFRIFCRELLLDDKKGTMQQYQKNNMDNSFMGKDDCIRSKSEVQDSTLNSSLLDYKRDYRRTFDITNAGPYQRFIIKGENGPFVVHNCVQATARDIMAHGMVNVHQNMPEIKLIGTVHDEIMGMIRESDLTESTYDNFVTQLCDIPWAKGIPLAADGFIAKRYKK